MVDRNKNMSKSDKEVLCEGWLTKSPPTKRIWRGRWRKRWFSLYPGELPGQFLLAYYTDRNCRKLKGIISLDQCEQVDTGLKFEDKKFRFDFLFAVKTQPRTYYLAADTDNEMKTWVKCICDVCGLKATSDDEDPQIQIIEEPLSEIRCNIPKDQSNNITTIVQHKNILESPPVSPVSTSPYIPISECVTGKSPLLLNCGPQDLEYLLRCHLQNSFESSQHCTSNHTNSTYDSAVPTYLNTSENVSKFYDSPRLLHPHNSTKSNRSAFDATVNSTPLQSPTDSESVFTDDDWTHNTLPLECDTKQTKPSDSSADMDIFSAQRLAKQSLDTNKLDAPPRPPKPTHINQGPSYFNIPMHSTLPKVSKDVIPVHSKSNSMCEDMTGQVVNDEMYDFPRSHQVETFSRGNATSSLTTQKRHCYNNAAPVACPVDGQIFRYDISPKPGTSNNSHRQASFSSSHVFHFSDVDDCTSDVVPASPSSQSSSTAAYSNLPSPLFLTEAQLMPPPVVNRCLKPKRKLSDTLSVSSAVSEQLLSSSSPPSSRPYTAPSVDRKLKPPLAVVSPVGQDSGLYGNVLKKPIENTVGEEEGYTRKQRAAPSPTPPKSSTLRRSYNGLNFSPLLISDDKEEEQIYHFFNKDGSIKHNYHKLEYLDLDLDNISSQFVHLKNVQPLRSPGANTVYKEVDFMKTEAFNITRNNLEKQRQNLLHK